MSLLRTSRLLEGEGVAPGHEIYFISGQATKYIYFRSLNIFYFLFVLSKVHFGLYQFISMQHCSVTLRKRFLQVLHCTDRVQPMLSSLVKCNWLLKSHVMFPAWWLVVVWEEGGTRGEREKWVSEWVEDFVRERQAKEEKHVERSVLKNIECCTI